VTSVPASDVEGAVLDHLQKLLGAPELIARTWRPQSGRTRTTSPSVMSRSCSPSLTGSLALLFLAIMMLASWEKKDGHP
jgi:hypothetical protein